MKRHPKPAPRSPKPPAAKTVKAAKAAKGAKSAPHSVEAQVAEVLAWLERHGTRRTRDGMARYGIHAEKAFGVTMADMKVLGKRVGRNHALAAALWETGWYEARMLTSFVDEPALVTPAQMDRWCRDFDSWAICDTVCFHLFDRSPHAWRKVAQWAGRREEFVRRGAFALLACLALHDRETADEPFLKSLRLVERAAGDERNFVRKGVSWALRAIGRRTPALHDAAVPLARRLAESSDAAERWVGKDVLRDITRPAILKGLAARRRVDAARGSGARGGARAD